MAGDAQSVIELVTEILSLTSGNGDQLAGEVGVSYASLYAWSRGRRRPSPRNLRALATVTRRRARRLSALADRLAWSEDDGGEAVVLRGSRKERPAAREESHLGGAGPVPGVPRARQAGRVETPTR